MNPDYLIYMFFGFGALVLVGAFLLLRAAYRRSDDGDLSNALAGRIVIRDSAGKLHRAQPGESIEDLIARLKAEDSDLPKGPHRPVVYMFQHRVLPTEAFNNHPELIKSLLEPSSFMPLMHMWSKAVVHCEDCGLIPEETSDDDRAIEEDRRLRSAIQIRTERRNGYTVYFITMPPPEAAPEAYFAAIVHKDSEPHEYMQPSPSTRYLTLEMASPDGQTMLCEWNREGSHLNYGSGTPPKLEPFANAVFQHVLQ